MTYQRGDPRVARCRQPREAMLVTGTRALVAMMWYAKPFLRAVFLTPMDKHRSGRPPARRGDQARAAPAAQAKGARPAVLAVHDRDAGRVQPAARSASCSARCCCARSAPSPQLARRLFSEDELARSQRMTFDELAEDALAAKLA